MMGNYKNLMEFINTIKTIKQFLLCSKKGVRNGAFFYVRFNRHPTWSRVTIKLTTKIICSLIRFALF